MIYYNGSAGKIGYNPSNRICRNIPHRQEQALGLGFPVLGYRE